MRLFLKSRSVGWCVTFIVLFELTVALWGGPALVVRHSLSAYAVPLSVFAQFVPAAVITFTVGSAHDALESLSPRPLRSSRAALVVAILLLTAAATATAGALLGPQGSLDEQAPLRAALGLCGATLILSTVVDRRVAGIGAGLLVLFPLVFDPDVTPAGRTIGFVVGQSDWKSWSTCLVLAAAGALSVALRSRGTGR
jgi:hypothetical protein